MDSISRLLFLINNKTNFKKYNKMWKSLQKVLWLFSSYENDLFHFTNKRISYFEIESRKNDGTNHAV